MAKFDPDTTGIESAVRALRRADLFTDEAEAKMLDAGGQVLEQAIAAAVRRSHHVRTGQLVSSIKRSSTVKKDKHGTPYITVTAVGKTRKGVRHAVKGFVLNYGRRTRGRIRADHFWTDAAEKATPAVEKAMQDAADRILSENERS